MTVPGAAEEKCGICGRYMYKRGVTVAVEAAIDPEGTSPVIAQLDLLRHSASRAERERWADLNERFKQLAAYGRLAIPREMRELSGELWEIKTTDDRIPFYNRAEDRAHRRAARLTFQFAKDTGKTSTGKTPRKMIDKGLWIMKGDIQHDANHGTQGSEP